MKQVPLFSPFYGREAKTQQGLGVCECTHQLAAKPEIEPSFSDSRDQSLNQYTTMVLETGLSGRFFLLVKLQVGG